MTNGRVEIEFETQLFIDLVGRIGYEIPQAGSSTNYRAFLDGLVIDNNGNRNLFHAKNYFSDFVASSSQYIAFKQEFRLSKPQYNPEALNPPQPYNNLTINPSAIKYFLENTNCYQ